MPKNLSRKARKIWKTKSTITHISHISPIITTALEKVQSQVLDAITLDPAAIESYYATKKTPNTHLPTQVDISYDKHTLRSLSIPEIVFE
jgi:hypothetical protein